MGPDEERRYHDDEQSGTFGDAARRGLAAHPEHCYPARRR
jgi:hypothetical protein